MPTKAELGHRLRVARFERNLTLKEVAARCGMSATHISEVERGKTSPTIGALQRIAAALGEKASYFVQENNLPRVRLTRLADRCEYFTADSEGVPLRLEVVSSGIPGGYAQVFRQRLEPDSVLRLPPRIGECVVLCVKGMVKMAAFGESHVLREGDTIQFRADDGSVSENISDEESETISILSGPTRLQV